MVGIINFIAAAFFFMIPNEIGFKSFTAASRPSNRENQRQNKIDIHLNEIILCEGNP